MSKLRLTVKKKIKKKLINKKNNKHACREPPLTTSSVELREDGLWKQPHSRSLAHWRAGLWPPLPHLRGKGESGGVESHGAFNEDRWTAGRSLCKLIAAAKSEGGEAEVDIAHLNGVKRSGDVFHHNPGSRTITCVTSHNDFNMWPATPVRVTKILQSGKKTYLHKIKIKISENTERTDD